MKTKVSEWACCDKSPNCDCDERYEEAQQISSIRN